MYKISVTSRARRQLKKLARTNPAAYRSVRDGIDSLSNWPDLRGVKSLRNHESSYRLRVGRFRVIFDMIDGESTIEVREVTKRDERTY